MNNNYADPRSSVIENPELSPANTAPASKPGICKTADDERVSAIDAMAACMLESGLGG